MGRDSILNDAEEKQSDGTQPAGDDDQDTEDDRVKLTQRMPGDLVDEVDRVQDEYALSSRNTAINFLVKQGLKEV